MSKSFVPSDDENPTFRQHGAEPSWVFSQHAAHILTMEMFPSGVQKKLLLEYTSISCSKKTQKGLAFFYCFSFKAFYRVELVPMHVMYSLCSQWNIPGTGNLEKSAKDERSNVANAVS